jgi:hypothetical protein
LNRAHPDIYGQLHTLVGAGIVAYKITKVKDFVRSVFKVADHRLKSFDVSMDI